MIYNAKIHDFTAKFEDDDKIYLWIENTDADEILLRYMLRSWEDQGTTALIKMTSDKVYIKHPHFTDTWIELDEETSTDENKAAIEEIKKELNKYLTSKLEQVVFDE